ncbi:AAA family ATPase [Flavobacterium geliluteum]|uniref:AAA family ATPase n=1 Tax=Flavobacterium geliluteum TaxID=2816120 RepID=A0A940X622_9FLAO|nr:AAA family ATPase [Flavobacterium geliluteum]MBP4136485.1 AAA family ATPase [Flavobacterium geliluteum]
MKPISILNLEKTLGFELNLSTIDDFFHFKNRNTYKIDDNDKVISLNLFENKITNIDFVKEFENLKELDLRNNPIRDFRPLENLKLLILFGYGIHKINSQSYIGDFLKNDIFDMSRHSSKIVAVYIHNHEFLFEKPQIINLGGRNTYCIESYDENSVELICKPNPNFIEHFFGEDIALVSAIVGENGTGKTSLLTKLFNQLIPVRTGEEECVFFIIEETEEIKYYSFFDLESDFKIISKNFKAKNEKSQFYGFPIYFSNYLSDNRIHKNQANSLDLSLMSQILNDLNSQKFKFYNSDFTFSFYKNTQLKRWMKMLSNKEITDILDDYSLPVFKKINIEFHKSNIVATNSIKHYPFKNASYQYREILETEVQNTLSTFDMINDFFRSKTSKYSANESNYMQTIDFLVLELMRYITDLIFNPEKTNIFPKIKNLEDFENLENINSSIEILKLLKNNFYFLDINNKKADIVFPFDLLIDFSVNFEKSIADNDNVILDGNCKVIVNFTTAVTILDLYEKFYFELTKLFKSDYHQFINFFPNIILSSGEEMIFNLISLLHDNKEINTNVDLPAILFLDEADLGLHPKWKKMFVNTLIKILPKIFIGLRIQIIFTTHDPLTLSDIPNGNIIYLKKENGKTVILDTENKPKKSFGANITDLLADSFFIDNGLMGDFAKAKIEDTIKWINLENYKKDSKSQELYQLSQDEYNHHKQIIELIDEPILKMKLAEMIDELKGGKDFQKELARKEIDFLKSKFGI